VGVQLFLSSQIMTRFGVGAALLVLPVMALGGSAAFMAAPMLLTAGALSVVDKGLSYSIQQSAKESLYVPTDWNEKYQAKGVIDVFLLRTVRGLAVLLGLGLSIVFSGFENLRWLSLATVLIIAIWIPTALYAGREFKLKAARNAKIRAELEQEAA
jgi:AAA family ATP:ADP antiporter